jgi:hypothetical protein
MPFSFGWARVMSLAQDARSTTVCGVGCGLIVVHLLFPNILAPHAADGRRAHQVRPGPRAACAVGAFRFCTMETCDGERPERPLHGPKRS